MSEYAIELNHITKSFGDVQVLKDVTLKVKKGQIVGLVGENGAGKSTMMNVLDGIYQKNGGEILVDGKPYNPHGPKDAAAAGIAFVQQELNLFTNLSVLENLYITGMLKNAVGLINKKAMYNVVKEKLKEIGADDLSPNAIIGTLPMGQRQMVEITKSIMIDANVIIFDEPTTSLSNSEKVKLFKIFNQMREQGKSIIFISHILEDVMEYTDEIAVLRDGEIISQRPTAECDTNTIIKEMVGRELTNIYPTCEKEVGDVVFQAKNICSADRFDNVNLDVREGEIVGIFGLMGAGRTELMRCIFGLDPMTSGEVVYKGNQIKPVTPENCIDNGMAMITENRREEGLLLPKTLTENIVLSSLKTHRKNGNRFFMDAAKEKEDAAKMRDSLLIKTFDVHKQQAGTLSGGNQQKVVFAKWVLSDPKVFILDEPTKGVDVGAKYEIYSIIQNLAKEKSAVIMVSSEIEELMGICDKILVMAENKFTGEFSREDGFVPEEIMKYCVGGAE
ncbi:MAG: sugar ABC transporter ATP-binding protein [Lachnospiraceae bacterium]|nr:sugar ABC transporter ATP-binding protein [Lachnospiraceae bacterium]